VASRSSIPKAFVAGYFRGRTALITGASSGIGRDLALSLAGMGARVALLARRKTLLEELAHEIATEGNEPLVLAADVTRRADCGAAVERAFRDFGHLDILINSAGIMEPGPVEALDSATLEQMMRVNLFGTLHMMQAVLPAMRKAATGNIVNVASLAGRRGMPPLGGYCATKFAVVGLTEALRVELYGSGVKLSLVMPGRIDTPMTQGGAGIDQLKGVPAGLYAMPVQWVTWAAIAAIVFGLPEVDVPPGAAILEKIAALMPGLTDSALALGLRVLEWTGRGREKSP
jgi:NAD(P)-dependent dehydrogenase (short-subunit alcohol dehydrogenase family)